MKEPRDTLATIQHALRTFHLDGWLLYDHHGLNPYLSSLFPLCASAGLTRRVFVWIPSRGKMTKIVHAIEGEHLLDLPGETITYITKQELTERLSNLLQGSTTIAMEYSPLNDNPYLSYIDGGTLEWIRSLGKRVVSSGDLLLMCISQLSPHQLALHHEAAYVVQETVHQAFCYITESIRKGSIVTEYQVQQYIVSCFKTYGCMTEEAPLCAAGVHTALPHYTPTEKSSAPIQEGDLVLIDLWCKKNDPEGIYADITRMGIVAKEVPADIQKVFMLVFEGQQGGIRYLQQQLNGHDPIRGCDVDAAVRSIITEGGYGQEFIHRTGHSIDYALHGVGTHLDSIENIDYRPILPRCCFSIEPGIYIPHRYGIRLETNAYITDENTLVITGGIQDQLILLS